MHQHLEEQLGHCPNITQYAPKTIEKLNKYLPSHYKKLLLSFSVLPSVVC